MSVVLQICKPSEVSVLQGPFAGTTSRASFPSPSDDYLEDFIDLNRELIKNRESTFYARVISGVLDSEFSEGDVLVVDRSLPLQNNKMVVCFLEGDFTVKRVRHDEGALWLETLNCSFDAIRLTGDNQYMIWGMVTYVVKRTW